MMRPCRHALLAGLVLVILAAPCCSSPCSTSLEFNAPVPDTTLRDGETFTYELFRNVWTEEHYCGGNTTTTTFPEAQILNRNPEVARVQLLSSDSLRDRRSLLHVDARSSGTAEVILRVRAEINCEMVLDATHFTVTVSAQP